MSNGIRIATWNLDRSGIRGKARLAPQLEFLKSVDADILVLTETHELVKPFGYDYYLASERDPGYHKVGESCATIWSRFPMTEIPTATENRYFTVCAEIQGPPGIGNVIVYGTIITYHGDGVSQCVPVWSRHRAAVKSQVAEWNALALRYSNRMRVVAGDFNENLDGRRWYGVADAKEALTVGMLAADMHCPTAAPDLSLFNSPGSLSRSTVNHVCVSNGKAKVTGVQAWEGTQAGVALSDHNGILVDFAIS